jgi:hypothetical protein
LKTVFRRGLPAVWANWHHRQPDPSGVLDALHELSRTGAFAWVCHVGIDLSERSDGPGFEEDWRTGLARHPAMPLVNEIDLTWAEVPAGNALADLADAGPLPALRVLRLLVENGGGDLDALRRATNLSGLRELDLSRWENVGTGRADPSPPFEWPPLHGLRRLDLHGTCCNAADLTRLAKSGHFPELRWINVSTSWVTSEAILALVASRRHPHLAEVQFDLADTDNEAFEPPAGAEFVRRLAGQHRTARLQALRLAGLGLGDADLEPLLASPHLAGLGHLNVHRNPLSPEVVRRLKARFPRVEAGG